MLVVESDFLGSNKCMMQFWVNYLAEENTELWNNNIDTLEFNKRLQFVAFLKQSGSYSSASGFIIYILFIVTPLFDGSPK